MSSLSPTILETYVTEGRALIVQLVHLWSERRVSIAQLRGLTAATQELQDLEGRLRAQQEDQALILESFKVSLMLC